jgi:hypothetical protein
VAEDPLFGGHKEGSVDSWLIAVSSSLDAGLILDG